MPEHDDRQAEVLETLIKRHPLFARATIVRWVAQAFDTHKSASTPAHVPALAEREIDARLRDLESGEPTAPWLAPPPPAPSSPPDPVTREADRVGSWQAETL